MSTLNFSKPIQQAKLAAAEGMLYNILAVDENNSRKGLFKRHIVCDAAITQVAKKCHSDIHNATLGACHYLTKFAHGSAVLLGVTAIPIVLTGMGLVHLCKNMDHLLLSGGVVAGALVVNKAVDAVFGVKPLNFLGLTLVATTHTLANKASDIAVVPYTRKEENVELFKRDRHVQKVQVQKEAYYGIAHYLASLYQQALKDPDSMYELKMFAKKLESKLPMISEALQQIDIGPSECSQILDEVITVLGLIDNFQLEVKSPKSLNDNQYNANLMSVLPAGGFAKNCISANALNHLQAAREDRLGINHTSVSYVHSVAVGLLSTLSVPAIAAAVTKVVAPAVLETATALVSEAKTGDAWLPVAGATALVAAGALFTGTKVGERVLHSYRQERFLQEESEQNHIEKATQDLTNIYDGIANYLLEQKKAADSDPTVQEMLHKQAQKIREKLPLVNIQIAKNPEIKHPLAVTHNLDQALSLILDGTESTPVDAMSFVEKIDLADLAFSAPMA